MSDSAPDLGSTLSSLLDSLGKTSVLSSVSLSADSAVPSGSPGVGESVGSGSFTALKGIMGEVFGLLELGFCLSRVLSLASSSSLRKYI